MIREETVEALFVRALFHWLRDEEWPARWALRQAAMSILNQQRIVGRG